MFAQLMYVHLFKKLIIQYFHLHCSDSLHPHVRIMIEQAEDPGKHRGYILRRREREKKVGLSRMRPRRKTYNVGASKSYKRFHFVIQGFSKGDTCSAFSRAGSVLAARCDFSEIE